MTPWVLRLIAANVVAYILTMASPALVDQLVFVPALVLLRPWTLVTYMFLHANLGHIFVNMLSLFFFGPRLEFEMGSRKFLLLYFISGISGALVSLIFTPEAAILGASGAVFGVMLGFAYFWPREPIYIWGVFPLQSRWLVLLMTVLSLLGGSGLVESGVAHFAHLGGFLGGYLYLKASTRRRPSPGVIVPEQKSAPSGEDVQRWQAIPRDKLHPVNREELDRILQKIQTQGPGALTGQERAFLDRFSGI